MNPRFVPGTLILVFAGFVGALLPGCAVDSPDTELIEDDQPATSPDLDEPGLDPQTNLCCYADCSDTPGILWEYVGDPGWGNCQKAAKAYCKGWGATLNKHSWRPCP